MKFIRRTSWDPSIIRPYKTDSFLRILNSSLVFRLCASPWFVRYGPQLLNAAQKVPGVKQMSLFIVKHTFYSHFCGGETRKEVEKTMESYRARGIGVILNFAVEAEETSLSTEKIAKAADRILQGMMESVDLASRHRHNFIAAKITALIPPAVLQRWTNTLQKLKQLFDAHADASDGRVSLNQFLKFQSEFPKLSADVAAKLFEEMDTSRVGTIDFIQLSNMFAITNKIAREYLLVDQCEGQKIDSEYILAQCHDFEVFDAILPYIDELIRYAKSKNVKVIIDAEWTHVQLAIDDIAVQLSKLYNGNRNDISGGINGGRPIIFATYQMYLKNSITRLNLEIERASRGNYNLGVKIVRGAYIVSESDRATKMGYSNPIHDSLEATHASFDKAIDICLQKIAEITPKTEISTPLPLQLLIASHNSKSVMYAWERMKQLNLDGLSDCVGFGQLQGMQDGTTCAIVANELKGYKCVPYGPVEVTIPYLVRRAQENSAVFGSVAHDKNNLWVELKKRLRV